MDYNKEILEKTGIFVFDNAVSSDLCGEIIATYNQNKHLHHKGKTGGGYNPRMKNSTDWNIKEENLLNKLNSILNLATEKILSKKTSLKKLSFFYSGLQFQHSKKNEGYFNWHSDNDEADANYFRVLAPIFYLNTIEVGGETEFMYQKVKIKPETGKLVIFPCTWEYYHRGVKPLSDDKYIITAFALSPRS